MITQQHLKTLDELKATYKSSIIPFNKMTKYYPCDRLQVWKASNTLWLVVDTLEFRGIITPNYHTALEVRSQVKYDMGQP